MANKKNNAENPVKKDRPVSLILATESYDGLAALAEINAVSINAFVTAQIDLIVARHAELIKKHLAQKKILQEEFLKQEKAINPTELFASASDENVKSIPANVTPMVKNAGVGSG